jgi:adenosylhomocysteine nucleosidase
MGRLQASLATTDAIKRWNPNYVILIGIAGGIQEKGISLGDVLISSRVIDYELQKVRRDGDNEIRYRPHEADPRLVGAARELRDIDWFKAKEISSLRPNSNTPTKHIGCVASGDKVITTQEYLARYRASWPEMIGVEMEAAGVASACFQAVSKPGFIMIKGVSDLADHSKGASCTQKWRRYACVIAATFLKSLLLSGPVPISMTSRETKQKITAAKKLLEKRWMYCQSGEFEKAVECAEKAAQIARASDDKKMLCNSLLCIASDIGDHLRSKHLKESDAVRITSRISSIIVELESLGLPKDKLYLEKALLAQLEKNSDDALKYAELAEANASDCAIVAEALIVRLQAYWQKGTPEAGLTLKARIEELTNCNDEGDLIPVIKANWLRTLCKTEIATKKDADEFAILLRKFTNDEKMSSARALMLIDEVVTEFGRANKLEGALVLLELALEIATEIHDPLRAVNIALQIAEVSAEIGRGEDVTQYLGNANKWLDILKSDGNKKEWIHRKATVLATRGRIENRLAWKMEQVNFSQCIYHRKEAYLVLKEALKFVKTYEADLVGDVELFISDLNLNIGETAMELGRLTEAANYFRHARSLNLPADERISLSIGARAHLGQAQAEAFSGRIKDARSLLTDFLNGAVGPDEQKKMALHNLDWLDNTVFPVTDWFHSDAAKDIRRKVALNGLRPVIAEQMKPLIEWFQSFPNTEKTWHPYSELLDIWGRGGFSRIAAAIKADPGNAITVDATCTEDISQQARIFCPFYDTVIVNWKGEICPALGIVPMPDHLGPPGAFGGQGYIRTSSRLNGKDGWHVAVGWGNFLPRTVSEFLATEAIALLRSGRIVILPGPLVGCTQSAVGWTDNLFVDTLLGGVVKTAGIGVGGDQASPGEKQSRILDLGTVNIPFIDDISLEVLDKILNDTIEWLSPLRHLLRGYLGSNQFRNEIWGNMGSYFTDIRDACRQLEERWQSLTKSQTGRDWRIRGSISTFSATEYQEDNPGEDSLTDLLRSVAGDRPNLGPWIPFWRLQQAGGVLNWTQPLDNRSIPPDETARRIGISKPVSQGWLFPGDGGPGMRRVARY